jgi:hypothetical protein
VLINLDRGPDGKGKSHKVMACSIWWEFAPFQPRNCGDAQERAIMNVAGGRDIKRYVPKVHDAMIREFLRANPPTETEGLDLTTRVGQEAYRELAAAEERKRPAASAIRGLSIHDSLVMLKDAKLCDESVEDEEARGKLMAMRTALLLHFKHEESAPPGYRFPLRKPGESVVSADPED